MIDEPENEADGDADDQTRDDGKIKCAVFTAVNDIARQAAEAQGKFWAEIEQSTDKDEHCAYREKQATQLLHGFHDDSLARVEQSVTVARRHELRSFVFRRKPELSG